MGDVCICGHEKIFHSQGHFQCMPIGETCECATFQFALIEKCPECGGDGADHEDSSKDCFECGGSGWKK